MNRPVELTDIKTLRSQARAHIEQSAVTPGYSANRNEIIALLNEALATEIVCALRYRRHHFTPWGIQSSGIADEFLVHSNEELAHADRLSKRIVQLGGKPDLDPDGLSARSHAEYVAGTTLVEMIQENLVAECIAVDSYREMIQYIGSRDPATSLMLVEILTMEEAHASELGDLLGTLPT